MAFSVEAVGSGSKVGGAGTTVTVAHTITSANLLLVGIGVGFNDAGTDPLTCVTGITYNGVAMSAVSGSDSDDGNFEGVRWYSLATPDTGTHNVVATVIDADPQVGIGIISFIDASATLGTPSVATNTTANPSVTVADTANGDIVVSGLATDASGGATTAGGTSIADIENVNADSDFNFQYQTASGPNTSCTWTNSTADGWAASGLAVKAAGGGGGGASGRDLMLMGCGA